MFNNQNQQYQDNFFNAINVISLLVGLENLFENRTQSEQNDVFKANEQEASYLLDELGKRLDEQDAMLKEILRRLDKEAP